MVETAARKLGGVEKAYEILNVKQEEYLASKQCLAELKVELDI